MFNVKSNKEIKISQERIKKMKVQKILKVQNMIKKK